MGETFGHNHALARTLQPIIANRLCRAQAFLYVTRFKQVLVIARPDAGIAIGLQFHRDLKPIALHLAGAALRTLNLIGNAG